MPSHFPMMRYCTSRTYFNPISMHPNPSRFHSPIVHFHFRSKYFPQVRPNDTVASELQPSQALAESRRLWILKNAPSDYQRIYSSVRGPVASRYSSSLTQVRLGCRQSRVLPGWTHFGPAASTWSATRWRRRGAASSVVNSSASQ